MARDMVDTAGVVVTRGQGASFEVLWAQRPAGRRPFGGFWSFVVGRVEEQDSELPTDQEGVLGADGRFARCALRELHEEFGVLVTDRGLVVSGFEAGDRRRRALGGWLEEAGRALATSRLRALGGWETPRWMRGAYYTEFFQLHLGADEREEGEGLPGRGDPDEVARAEWIRPSEALERWRRGEAMLTTPLRRLIESLEEVRGASATPFIMGGDEERDQPFEVVAGVRLLPVETQTLPPSTHTNVYILGGQELWVVDPGCDGGEELALLFDALDRLVAGGAEVSAVVLTHHHRDHVAGAEAVVQRYGCAVWAHRETARRVEDVEVDRHIEDGERIALSERAGDEVVFFHTPGHAPGHLALLHRGTGAMLVGDLVVSEGTILIDPVDGDMGRYLASLELIRREEPRRLLPAHGMPIEDVQGHIGSYLAHRRERERAVLGALRRAGEKVEPADLVAWVYEDVAPEVWPLAARSLEAHLVHLVEQELAGSEGGRYWAQGHGEG